MDNISIWQKNSENNINNNMFQTIKTDILIIGGGIAGLVTAYMLSENNQDITLIDKKLHSIRYYNDYIIYTLNEHKLTKA